MNTTLAGIIIYIYAMLRIVNGGYIRRQSGITLYQVVRRAE